MHSEDEANPLPDTSEKEFDMALLEDMAKGVTPTGIAVSIGTVVLAPYVVPALASVFRPAAKGVLSTGISLYRQAMEPVSKAMSGLVAEAQLELASAKAAAASVPVAAPPAAAAAAEEDAPAHKQARRNHKDAGEHAATA